MPDLLLELGTEELPARFIDRAMSMLAERAYLGLQEACLPPQDMVAGATPRRLAICAKGLPERQPDRTEERWGPAKQAAFRDGQPTIAAQKFAESVGLPVEKLETREKKKGKKVREHLYAAQTIEGRDAITVLGELIPRWIESIHWAKSMRWVPGSKLRFGRPLRRIVALLGDAKGSEVVPAEWAGVKSGRQTVGHRFLEREPFPVEYADWQYYVEALRAKQVIVDPKTREDAIRTELVKHLGVDDLAAHEALVREVTNLVEWPAVDVAEFAEHFLQLPEIVIVSAMTNHQRYFPIRKQGKLAARFAYVANRPLHPVIREGNQRVLAARLSDALFFFRLDQKRPLPERIKDLDEIVFMEGLGSYQDRIPRIANLALEVAKAAGWAKPDAKLPDVKSTKITRSFGALPTAIVRAAQLARADLTTEVVGEFPELQGEMGTIYARAQGESEEVALALREAYLPRGEGDDLPESKVGIAIAVADKLDTIVSAWATGKKPTGSKDPFMVRRSTLGVLRILRERELDLGYGRLIEAAVCQLPDALRREGLVAEIAEYLPGRLKVLAVETLEQAGVADSNLRHTLAQQALGAGSDPSNVLDFFLRVDALRELAQDERWTPLCELVERTKKITEKNGTDVDPGDVDAARLEHAAEQALHAAIAGCRETIRSAITERRYVDAGRAYADTLAGPVHTFFEPAPVGVFVMHDDARLRTNRLALLKQVHALLAEGFADLAQRG